MDTPRILRFILALALVTAALPLTDAGTADAPARMIVGFGHAPDLREGDAYHGGDVILVSDALGFAVVETPDRAAWEERVRNDPRARFVEPDVLSVWVTATPDDPLFDDQYGPEQVRAPEAWDAWTGSTSRVVCVVDTGVRYTHEDLRGARWLGGHDFVNGDDDPWDDHGHGTHVAGIAAATLDNGKGIAGVAQAGILGVKVLNAGGSGYLSHVAEGIRWCADNGGDVINLSLGTNQHARTLSRAVEYAYREGALPVAAAGNAGPCEDCIRYPARYEDAVAVTCTTKSLSLCRFSSTGPEAELAAPGYRIVSTFHEGDASYAWMSGTSMSAPHVSAVAALVWSWQPQLTNVDVRRVLAENAQEMGDGNRSAEFGYGIVDAKASLDAVNVPPVADAGPERAVSDTDGTGDETVTLDGGGSHDEDGTITAHEWYQGDAHLATGAVVDVTLPVGDHTITLVVTDDEGATASDEVSVVVAPNQAPTALMAVACDGTTCVFNGTTSHDPDGVLVAHAWDFGDGVTDEGPVASHTFATAERHRVTLTVTDNGNGTGAASFAVGAPDAPRNLRATPAPFHWGTTLSWNPPHAVTDLPVTGYEVHRTHVVTGATAVMPVGLVHSYTDTHVPAGAYTYRVRAVNDMAPGAFSGAVHSAGTRLP